MKLLVCLMSTLLAGAVSADERSDANTSCRQEARQVVVWPHGPKAAPTTRVEERVVKVCQAKAS